MSHINIEIKARCSSPDGVRRILTARNATFRGTDRQVDTYFNVPRGRLKLREGTIENSLIHYDREDKAGPKKSHVTLYESAPDPRLKEILTRSLGVLAVVEKTREIYFIDNIKFHIDEVDRLGSFVEIEAIDISGAIGQKTLEDQCSKFMMLFNIRPEDLMSQSYADMLEPWTSL